LTPLGILAKRLIADPEETNQGTSAAEVLVVGINAALLQNSISLIHYTQRKGKDFYGYSLSIDTTTVNVTCIDGLPPEISNV
jgi:hypothetical protein